VDAVLTKPIEPNDLVVQVEALGETAFPDPDLALATCRYRGRLGDGRYC